MCANEIQRDYGNPNHNAPNELSQFGFLIGKWRCDVQTVAEDGALATFKAIWLGRYILDGYVIADEYRMMDRSGQLVMLGSNYRSYNVKTNTWVMKWHDALASTWLELGPEDLGGVQITDTAITFKARFEFDVIHRITFSNITEEHLTWQADSSSDAGQTWNESIMVIEAYRAK